MSACSSSGASNNTRLLLSQDLYVTQGAGAQSFHKKGESIELSGKQPVLLEAPGYVAMLLVPTSVTPSQLTATLRPIDKWSGETLDNILNSKTNEIVEEVNRIQILLSSRREKEALEKVETLQRKYPKVTYLNFFRASALFMLGERDKSRGALQAALKDFPGHTAAKSFYKSLGGVE